MKVEGKLGSSATLGRSKGDLRGSYSSLSTSSTSDMSIKKKRSSSFNLFQSMQTLPAIGDEEDKPLIPMSETNKAARETARKMLRQQELDEAKARAEAIEVSMMAAHKRRSSSMMSLLTDDDELKTTTDLTEATKELIKQAEQTADKGSTRLGMTKLMELRTFFLSIATESNGKSPRVPLKTCLQLQKENHPQFTRNNIKRLIAQSKTPNVKSCSFRMLLPCWFPGISQNEVNWAMKVAFPPTVAENPETSSSVRKQMKALFNGWDTDKDGTISHRELSTALGTMGYSEGDISTLFDFSDKDRNNLVDFDEFQRMMGDFLNAA